MKPCLGKVLIVEDNPDDAFMLKRFLGEIGYSVEMASNVAEGLPRAQSEDFDVVVTDLDLKVAGQSGLELISLLRDSSPHLPVILLTGLHSPSAAIDATKLGAYDYYTKPVSWTDATARAELMEMLKKAVESKQLMDDRVEIGESSFDRDSIIGRSRAMQEVYKEIGRVATSSLTVLIRGETGTGKELVARAIFSHSNRDKQPFIVVNCAAIPESLLEAELFGHERGAFTGANIRRLGRFEQAHGGTIFLDEIGDMNAKLQQKMLRVLQEKTIERVGGKGPVSVDARVIAATHRDLEQAVRDGDFRQDLYYRLNVAVISLPPLRERKDDLRDTILETSDGTKRRIVGLVNYFIRRDGAELRAPCPDLVDKPVTKLETVEDINRAEEIFQQLEQHAWPGNVRELRNVIRKALLMSRGFPINPKIIAQVMEQMRPPRPVEDQSFAGYVSGVLAGAKSGERENVLNLLTEAIERELYGQAIRLAKGDQSQACSWLGVSRPTMREKLLKYGLHPSQVEETAA